MPDPSIVWAASADSANAVGLLTTIIVTVGGIVVAVVQRGRRSDTPDLTAALVRMSGDIDDAESKVADLQRRLTEAEARAALWEQRALTAGWTA